MHDLTHFAGDYIAHGPLDSCAHLFERRRHRGRIPVGRFPFSAVRMVDDRLAQVTADNARGVAVLDIANLANLGLVPTGRIPHAITAGPDGRFYVSNNDGNTVSVLRRAGAREDAFEVLYAAE